MTAPVARTPARRDDQAGFTLIELLVSLALLALLMAAIPPALDLAGRTRAATITLDQDAAAAAAIAFVEQRLAEATAIYERGDDGRLRVLFRGEPGTISFVAPLAVRVADAGLARFTVAMATDGDGRPGLQLTWQPWRPLQPDGTPVAPPPLQSRLIIPGARALDLRYFGAPSASEPAAWATTWPRADTLPDLVEFRISRPGNSALARTVALRLKLP